jgi:acyl carrier protein
MTMPADKKDEVRRGVQELISQVLERKRTPKKPEEIVDGLSLTRDLGIDSLDILQLTAVVEKRYALKIPEAELRGMDDLSGIIGAVERHWPAK